MHNIKVKALAAIMASLTAITPVASAYTEVYASSDTADTVTELSVSEDEQNETESTEGEEEAKFLFINLNETGGKVVIDEGKDQEQSIRLEKRKDGQYIDVYDKDNVLISSELSKEGVYVYETKANEVVNIKAVPDDGYGLAAYEVTKDDVVEDSGYNGESKEFGSALMMESDKTVKVEFEKVSEDENEDLTVDDDNQCDSEDSDLTVNDSEDSTQESDETQDGKPSQEGVENDDLTVGGLEEATDDDVDDTDMDVADADVLPAEDVEAENSAENVEAENSEVMPDTAEDVSEGVEEDSDVADNVGDADASTEDIIAATTDDFDINDFSSSRLIVMADNKDIITDTDREYLIGEYDNLYLLQYETAEDALNAYVYYLSHASAVEPDKTVEAAEGTADTAEPEMVVDENTNPISTLSEEEDSGPTQNSSKVVALIDTGVNENPNVIDRVSLIDDTLSGNGHGDDMVNAIASQYASAKILSIRAIGDDGKGTVSSIVAGMEYAINQNVDVINLSLYAKSNTLTSVLTSEIQKAQQLGIEVVGAAGNDGADAKDYIPGCVNEAWIIGACDSDGVRIPTSNYGNTVDYNVVADSTSEAAAKFSGYILKNGIENLEENGFIFENSDFSDNTVESDKSEVLYIAATLWTKVGSGFDPATNTDGLEDYIPKDASVVLAYSDLDMSKAGSYITIYHVTSGDSEYAVKRPVVVVDSDESEVGEYAVSFMADKVGGVVLNADATWYNAGDVVEFSVSSDDDVKIQNVKAYIMSQKEDSNEVFGDEIALEKVDNGEISEAEKASYVNGNATHYRFTMPDEDVFVNVSTEDDTFQMAAVNNELTSFVVNQSAKIVSYYNGSVSGTGRPRQTRYRTVTYKWKRSNGKIVSSTVACYCIQPSKNAPLKDGDTLFNSSNGSVTQISDSSVISKALYYLYGGHMWNKTVTDSDGKAVNMKSLLDKYEPKAPGSTDGNGYYTLTHLILGYLYSSDSNVWNKSDDGISGPVWNSTGITWLASLKTQLQKLPAPTVIIKNANGKNVNNASIARSDFSVYSTNAGTYRSTTYTYVAAPENKASIKLPAGIKLHYWYDTSAGKRVSQISEYGASVSNIPGGSRFFIEVNPVKFNQSSAKLTFTTTYSTNFEAWKITTGATTQDLGFGYRTGDDKLNITFSVPTPAKLTVRKHVTNYDYLITQSKRYGKLSTTFSVYSDSGCTKPVVHIDIEGDADNPSSGKGTAVLKPGTYYVKEIIQIPGHTKNTAKYGPIKLKEGDNKDLRDFVPADKRATVSMDKNGTVLNYPFRYRGKLLTKCDANTNKPLAGAVFKFQYSEYRDTANTSFKALRTWYFVTDSNGEIKYEKSYLTDNYAKFKNKYKNSPMFTFDGKSNALPPCALKVTEVEAPDGYALDANTYNEYTVYQKDSNGNDIVTNYNLAMNKNLVVKDPPVFNEWSVQVNVKKIDAQGNGLPNAVFWVFENEEDARNEENQLAQLTTGADGVSQIYVKKDIKSTVNSITLYCKELKAPDGYVKTDTIYSLTFNKSEYDKLYAANSKTEGQLQTFGGAGIINPPKEWSVSAWTKKIDKSGNPLAGAKFGIYDNAACTGEPYATIVSGADGVTNTATINVGNQDEITLYCKELEAPEGYALTDEIFSQTWNKADYPEGSTTGEVKQFGPIDGVVNDKGWQVNVFAKKINTTKNPLEGAEFTVYSDKALTKKVGVLTSGKDGVTNTLSMTMSPSEQKVTLYCKETKAPAGCTLSDTVFEQTFTKAECGDKDSVTKQFGPADGIVNPDPWKIQYKLKKVATDGSPLAGAEFGVYTKNSCDDYSQIGTLISGEDGWTDVNILDIDDTQESITLYCKEITAPEGYQLRSEVFKQTWSKADFRTGITADPDFNGEEKLFGTENGIVNKTTPKDWMLRYQTKKIAENGSPLKDAEFEVYTDKNCSEESLVGTLTSGEDGMTDILGMSVDESVESITIYCKETRAPEGYTLNAEVYPLTYTKKDYEKELEKDNEEGELKLFGPADGRGIVDKPIKPVTVKIHKTSTAESDIFDLDGYTVEGAEFTIESDSGFSTVLTTGKDGNTDSIELPNETASYLISETKAPNGHEVCDPQSFSVTMPDDGGKDLEFTFADEPAVVGAQFKIVKTSTKGNPISGVVFKVEFFDGDDTTKAAKRTWYLVSDSNGEVLMDDAHLSSDSDCKSDEFYKHYGNIVIPVGGTLRVTEFKAPAQYAVDSTPKLFKTTEDTVFEDEIGNIVNDLVPGKIRIKKLDSDGETALKGVTFMLEYLEETEKTAASAAGYADTRLLKVGESVEATTDANGEIVWDNLDQGKYRITETGTVAGHTLLTEPIEVTLPITMTDADAKANKADTSKGVLDKGYTGNWFFYDCLYEVTNSATFKLPMTGGSGMWKYALFGFGTMAVMGAGLVLFSDSKKKRKTIKHMKHAKAKRRK